MKHTIYEDPVTHKFAFVRIPNTFLDGDKVTFRTPDRWFESHAEAIAALASLLDVTED
jgi:hypothetical protein